MLPSFEFKDALHSYMGEWPKKFTKMSCKRTAETFLGVLCNEKGANQSWNAHHSDILSSRMLFFSFVEVHI